MAGVREICDRYGIVFIADEVMAGFGRTGKWFAIDHFGVVPDLITFAKGVNSGYVPLGGVAISAEDRGDVRRTGLPRRTDVLGPPARHRRRRRDDQRDGGRGIVEHAARIGARSSAPDCAASPNGTVGR